MLGWERIGQDMNGLSFPFGWIYILTLVGLFLLYFFLFNCRHSFFPFPTDSTPIDCASCFSPYLID